MFSNSDQKIAMLLKSEVRELREEYLAGCERVFVEDARYLNSTKRLVRVYAAINSSLVFEKDKVVINHIYYPHVLIEKITTAFSKIPVFTRFTIILDKIFILLTQFYYAAAFVYKEHDSQSYYVIQTPLVALFFPNKTKIMIHNFYENWEYVFKLLFFVRRKKSAITCTFVSHSLLRQYLRNYPIIHTSHNIVLHNAVDIKLFKPKCPKNKTITFVFLSAWVNVKGVHLLPKLVENLNRKHSSRINFVIGGGSKLWSLPEKEYEEYKAIGDEISGLPKKYTNVKVLGLVNRSQVISLLKAATFCLLPSVWPEPNALLITEAMACGTPVIAFDIGGNKEVIKHKKNGYLVKTISVEALTASIEKIIKEFNWNNYKQMSAVARTTAEKRSDSIRHKQLLKILLG